MEQGIARDKVASSREATAAPWVRQISIPAPSAPDSFDPGDRVRTDSTYLGRAPHMLP